MAGIDTVGGKKPAGCDDIHAQKKRHPVFDRVPEPPMMSAQGKRLTASTSVDFHHNPGLMSDHFISSASYRFEYCDCSCMMV